MECPSKDYYRMGCDKNQKGLHFNRRDSCITAFGFKRGVGVRMTSIEHRLSKRAAHLVVSTDHGAQSVMCSLR